MRSARASAGAARPVMCMPMHGLQVRKSARPCAEGPVGPAAAPHLDDREDSGVALVRYRGAPHGVCKLARFRPCCPAESRAERAAEGPSALHEGQARRCR